MVFDIVVNDQMRYFLPPQDDMHVRIFNYNTLERVHQYEAHSDYLRSIAVHPTQPYILTSSGKNSPTIKLHLFIYLFIYFVIFLYVEAVHLINNIIIYPPLLKSNF